ncbi:hypothetical protein ACFPYN_09730 [Paenisporosarcina macmurdoensis]|uniref:Uncharacterized protein n=1 Tax=Paenisporosarcina macmurdoensis TaxID=212659 RepID=A0ABW1L9U0_9BACL
MKQIDVLELAKEMFESHKEQSVDEIAELVNNEFNGKKMTVETMPSEILMMVSQLISVVRKQEFEFTVNLVQRVVDELQQNQDS